jgi:hypothetical protein
MNSIDSIKSKLTDAEYKELCDGMLLLNNEMIEISKSKEQTLYHEVSYIDTRIDTLNDEEFEINHKVKKTIVKFNRVNAETIADWKREIDLYGSVTLGIAHFTGIDDVKTVNVRYEKCECECDGDPRAYNTIHMCYARLTVIRIKDL